MISCLLYLSSSMFMFYIIADILWRVWKRRFAFLPNSPNLPWVGCLPYVNTDAHAFFKKVTKYYREYDHLYVMWFGPTPVVKIGNVDYLEVLLKSKSILKKSPLYKVTFEWLGTSLSNLDSKEWKKRRMHLTPAFHFSILKNFIEDFAANAGNFVDRLRTLSKEKESIEVQELTSLVTLDIMCETAMGVQIHALESCGSIPYCQAVNHLKKSFRSRIVNPLLRQNSIYQYTSAAKLFYEKIHISHDFTTGVINKRIAARNSDEGDKQTRVKGADGERKKIFLDILLDLYEKGEIDLKSVRWEVDNFTFAGHDTTSSALSWTIYEIGRHPDVQEKLIDEADRVSALQCSTSDKISSLKYLDCVIKESLRLHPPVHAFSRVLEEDLVIGKDVIPVGAVMSIDAHSVHMNEKYWQNPSLFNPDRFESEEFLKRNPYCYIPFSAGPRNCIGRRFAMLEMKIILLALLTNFTWGSLQTLDEVETCFDMVTLARNGIHVKFSSR